MRMSPLQELPPNLFHVRRRDIDDFVDNMRDYAGLSAPAAQVSKKLLRLVFETYGSSDTQDGPKLRHGRSLAYHNGSHSAYVFGGSLWLAAAGGAGQREIDITGITAAGHDIVHNSTIPGEDEQKSVEFVQRILRHGKLKDLAPAIAQPLLGTIVEKIDSSGIYQRAKNVKDAVGGYVADGDMFGFIAPDAPDIALRLYDEQMAMSGQQPSRQGATAHLLRTAALQENHSFITPLAQDVLRPLALERAAYIREKLDFFVAD